MLRLYTEGPVARILIDHPERRNAFTRAMWRALPELVQQAVAAPQVRVLALQGVQSGVFAAGADISEFDRTYTDAQEAIRANDEIQTAANALAACPRPVVALIDGACIGGGISLATACDFRLATPQACFAVTPSRLGLSYHPSDLLRLVRACGLGAASELLFGGQMWNAQRALQAGLVNQLIPAADFTATTDALLQAIAANSVTANDALKRGLRAVVDHDAAGFARSVQNFHDLFSSPDFIEGRDAFLQKRPAAFPSHRKPE